MIRAPAEPRRYRAGWSWIVFIVLAPLVMSLIWVLWRKYQSLYVKSLSLITMETVSAFRILEYSSRMRWIVGGIILYTLVFSGTSIWKFNTMRYNARDLAIYNQIVWQLAGGESGIWNLESGSDNKQTIPKFQILNSKFFSSIQGHNYLGDHIEPILLLIVPFYKFFLDPRTLLVIQTLALALTAIPLYAITQHLLKNQESPKQSPDKSGHATGQTRIKNQRTSESKNKLINFTPILVGILWLLYPAVQNANLYEFHSVAFAPLFLLSLFWAYLKVRVNVIRPLYGRIAIHPYFSFLIFLLLSLSVREDVALITFMLGLLWTWSELRKPPLTPPYEGGKVRGDILAKLTPPILTASISIVWFLAAQRLITYFSPSQGYQYRMYYVWLKEFSSTPSLINGVLNHLLTLANLEMLIGLLLPLLFLPLLKPKWLLLALPPLAAITLSQAGGSSLIWQTHYGLLILPGIFLAFVSIIAKWQNGKMAKLLDPTVSVIAVLTATVASSIAFGPTVHAIKAVALNQSEPKNSKNLIAAVPPQSPIAATDRFLAPLSSRRELVLLPLAMLGVQQYGAATYPLRKPPLASPSSKGGDVEVSTNEYPEYILLDEEDVWADLVQARSLGWTRPFAYRMRERFRTILTKGRYRVLQREENAVLLIRSDTAATIPPFTFEEKNLTQVRGGLELDRLGSVRLVNDSP